MMYLSLSAFRLYHTPPPAGLSDVVMGITVGTRHAVSANAKDDTMGVSDTACRVPTWRNKVRGHLKLET